MAGLYWPRKGDVHWDAIIIWLLLLAGLLIIIGIIAASRGKMGELVSKIGDIFRFGA